MNGGPRGINLRKWRERVGTRGFVLLVFTILSVLAFEEVADDVFRDIPEGDLEAEIFDDGVAGWFGAVRSPRMTQVMTELTALGSVSVLAVLALAVAGILAMRRDHRRLLQLVIIAGGALLIPAGLKHLFDRPRPDVVDHLVTVSDLSFPSGHAFGATAIYLFVLLYCLTYLVRPLHQGFGILFTVTLVALVGFSRIYLGVHYATDVLGGISAGAAWSFGVACTFEILGRRGGTPGHSPRA